MKKKIYSGAFALALLVAATVGVQESKKNDVLLNDLAFANVEALANGENDGKMEIKCKFADLGNYTNNSMMWRCQDCKYSFVKNISSSSDCYRY